MAFRPHTATCFGPIAHANSGVSPGWHKATGCVTARGRWADGIAVPAAAKAISPPMPAAMPATPVDMPAIVPRFRGCRH
ncbi:hypothetical protein GCM10022268_17790 [Sphingomonas cynarae]|uniref:Uncharacterized protein n=1 Tax=Sphingomonas cynarae TaxID=930197 RepID=A0ABP7DQP0_9SPHN